MSSASTTHSSTLSPCLEKQQTDAGVWSPLSEQDSASTQAKSKYTDELQSVMEAEVELSAIWGPKTKKLKVRQVTNSAAHPIN